MGGMSAFGTAHAASLNMVTAGRTSQPIGHFEFCQTYAGECRATGTAMPIALTQKSWDDILDVNADVNAEIYPMTDMQIHGVEEVWSFPADIGDCEDFVLEKRRRLIEMGYAASNLLVTVVLQPSGAGHAVLTVRTDRGDYILDNMRGGAMLWLDTEYTYLKRQSTQHAGTWETINDNREPMAVGSVR